MRIQTSPHGFLCTHPAANMAIRLQKYLAEAGVASRRAAEQLIAEGRVMVDGEVIDLPGFKVGPDQYVFVDGKEVRPKKRVYLALNKPRGILCTRSDEKGRKTVMELIPNQWQDAYPVGRLDMDSEGLLLLTNDGDFCAPVTHPRNKIFKTYHVRVRGKVEEDILEDFKKGVRDGRDVLRIKEGELVEASNRFSHFVLTLGEGKNREIRRLFKSRDIKVTRLMRTEIGRIRLGELPSGKWRTLTDAEIKSLLSA